MTPSELERIARRMYGRKHWRSRLAVNLGIDNSTIWRAGRREQIPHLMEVAVRGLDQQDKQLKYLQRQEDERLRQTGQKRPKLKRRSASAKASARQGKPDAQQ